MYLSEVFKVPLGDPLAGRFSSQRLSVLLPFIMLPLNIFQFLDAKENKILDHPSGQEIKLP